MKSKINKAICQEVLEHFMFPSADQLHGDADFLFYQDVAAAYSAKMVNTKWFADYVLTEVDGQGSLSDLNPRKNQKHRRAIKAIWAKRS